METRKYKTLVGLIRQTNYKKITAEDFFSASFATVPRVGADSFCQPKKNGAPPKCLQSTFLLPPSARRGLADALCEGRGDFSFFQSFYIILSKGRGIYVGTTLSGPGFDFC